MEPLQRGKTAIHTSNKSLSETLKGCMLRAMPARSATGPDFLCLAGDAIKMDNLIN